MRCVVVVFILVLTFPTHAAAGIFKCLDSEERPIYQDHVCSDKGERLELRSAEPSAQEREQGQERQRRQRQLVEEHEAELERARVAAELDRKRQLEGRQALAARCARYEEKIAEARRGERRRKSPRPTETESLAALEAKHFSECFGRR